MCAFRYPCYSPPASRISDYKGCSMHSLLSHGPWWYPPGPSLHHDREQLRAWHHSLLGASHVSRRKASPPPALCCLSVHDKSVCFLCQPLCAPRFLHLSGRSWSPCGLPCVSKGLWICPYSSGPDATGTPPWSARDQPGVRKAMRSPPGHLGPAETCATDHMFRVLDMHCLNFKECSSNRASWIGCLNGISKECRPEGRG